MKPLNTRFLTLLTMLAFLGFSVSAFAAKWDCDDENSTHPKCNPDSGGEPFPVTTPDNTGQYAGGGITEERFGTGIPIEGNPVNLPVEAPPRFCLAEVIQLIEGKVHHECEKGGLVTFNLSGWQNVAKNGKQGYCDLLNKEQAPEYRQFTPTRFWFRNDAGCDFVQGECDVRVSAWSYRGDETGDRHQYFDLSAFGLEDAGLTGFGGSAIIPTAVGRTGGGDGNPFADSQTWNLYKVSVNFKLAGKNKTAATCQVSWADGTLSRGDALFITTPVP